MAHSFTPIETAERFEQALDYIAQQSLVLGGLVITDQARIDTVTVFTQTAQEYNFAEQCARRYGPVSDVSHGATLYIDSHFTLQGNVIQYLGVRRPDSSRIELGYADFPVDDFPKYVEMAEDHPHMQLIESGRGRPMIELRHTDFDVRGYIVNAAEH